MIDMGSKVDGFKDAVVVLFHLSKLVDIWIDSESECVSIM